MDRHQKVRGSFDLGGRSTFDRVVAERGLVYQALLFGAVLFVGRFGGAWTAGTASASFYSLPAVLITVVPRRPRRLVDLDRLQQVTGAEQLELARGRRPRRARCVGGGRLYSDG